MNIEKQVDKSNYEFSSYMSKGRWCSLWHQLDEIVKLKPEKVLEVGPGPGLFKSMAAIIGISVETLDLDPDLNPDHIGSATAMPLGESTFDVVCAFQVLEHLPYELSLQAFREMVRVSRRHVVISLPNAQTVWRYQFHIPKFGSHDYLVSRPQFTVPVHKFNGEHYWELNTRGYPLSRIVSDFSQHITLADTYLVRENPYHRFFIFEKF